MQSNVGSGLLRIIFFLWLLFFLPLERLVLFANLEPWQMCMGSISEFFTFQLSAGEANAISVLLRMSLIASAFGLFTRFSYAISFVSFAALVINWRQFCFGTYHLHPIPIALLFWLILDDSSTLRLDTLIARNIRVQKIKAFLLSRFIFKKPFTFNFTNYFAGAEACSFTQLIKFQRWHFSLVFFSAGVSKLLNAGPKWIQAPNLENTLIVQNFSFEGQVPFSIMTEINHWFTGHPMLCVAAAVATLTIELSAPLANFSSVGRRIIIPGIAVMQIGIFFLVYINFSLWLCLYFFWLPLKWFDQKKD